MDPGSSRTSRVSRSSVLGRGRTGFQKTAFLHYSAVPAFIPALSIHGQKSVPPTRGHGTGPLRSRARGAAATSRRVRLNFAELWRIIARAAARSSRVTLIQRDEGGKGNAPYFNIGARYCPVKLRGFFATCSGVPLATISPPLTPPSGPRSRI